MNDKNRPPLLKSNELPLPRLELRWSAPDAPPPEGYPAGTQTCRYLLVMPLGKWDVRREDETGEQVRDILETELGCTVRSHGMPQLVWPEANTVDTPYRAGRHIACGLACIEDPGLRHRRRARDADRAGRTKQLITHP